MRYFGSDVSAGARRRASLAWAALILCVVVLGAASLGAGQLVDRFKTDTVGTDVRFALVARRAGRLRRASVRDRAGRVRSRVSDLPRVQDAVPGAICVRRERTPAAAHRLRLVLLPPARRPLHRVDRMAHRSLRTSGQDRGSPRRRAGRRAGPRRTRLRPRDAGRLGSVHRDPRQRSRTAQGASTAGLASPSWLGDRRGSRGVRDVRRRSDSSPELRRFRRHAQAGPEPRRAAHVVGPRRADPPPRLLLRTRSGAAPASQGPERSARHAFTP